MVKLEKIIGYLNEIAPFCYAEEYDNVGLLIGNKDKEISSVLITLDSDVSVVSDAYDKGCDLVISHHPLIFRAIKRVVSDDNVSRTVMEHIKRDIPLVSVHTNFDGVKSGLCDLFLDKIAPVNDRCAIEGDAENGAGRIADLKNPSKLGDILSKVKKEFNIKHLKFVGDADKTVKRIAVCNGGGADFIYSAFSKGCDLYISGDIKYHHARFAYENGLALIDVPHYNAEIMFCDYLKSVLEKEFGTELKVLLTDKNTDVWNEF